MGSIKDYFKGLGQGVTSLFKGLSVTGKEFVTPKITEKYPDNRENMNISQRFRARLELVYDKDGNHKCIACGTCERVCPNGTITLETKMTETWDGKKKKKLEKYIYDLGSCTFCQLCVQNCPTHALDFSNDFEQAVFTRDQLVKKLNYLPEKPEPEPTPEQRAKFEAEKKAKAEAARKAAEAKAAAAAAAAAAPAEANAAANAAPAVELDEKAKKALAAAEATGDPEKIAKVKAALEKAAALKAAKGNA